MYCVEAKRRYTKHQITCNMLAEESEAMRKALELIDGGTDESKKLNEAKQLAEDNLPLFIYLATTTKQDFDKHDKSLKLFTGHELSEMPCAIKYTK